MGRRTTLPISDEPPRAALRADHLYRRWPAKKVIGEYLAEVGWMIAGSDGCAVFPHRLRGALLADRAGRSVQPTDL